MILVLKYDVLSDVTAVLGDVLDHRNRGVIVDREAIPDPLTNFCGGDRNQRRIQKRLLKLLEHFLSQMVTYRFQTAISIRISWCTHQ